MKKRMIALLLALAVLAGLSTALAASAVTVRLTGTGVGLYHYITYDYGDGVKTDSRRVSAADNYAAWQKMNDSDRRAVTKWFAGYTSQLVNQFGKSGAAAMLDYANKKSGWNAAGDELRSRLAQKNYPELYAFYGDPDKPNACPTLVSLSDLRSVSDLSAAERVDLESDLNDFAVAYQEGLEAYQKLIRLKQAQTNAAVTSISSGLIDIIMDNMTPPKSLGSLKDAAKKFADQGLGISDAVKNTLKKYSGAAYLTGEDQRIDAKEAAQLVQTYWKLMAAREDFAQAGLITCQRMQGDLAGRYDRLVETDKQRSKEAEAEKQRREEAAKREATEGAQTMSGVNPPYTREHFGEGEDGYNAYVRSCMQWASGEYNNTFGEISGFSDAAAYPPEGDVCNPRLDIVFVDTSWFLDFAFGDWIEAYDVYTFNGLRKQQVLDFASIFAGHDYIDSTAMLERDFDEMEQKLEKAVDALEAAAAAWPGRIAQYQSETQHLRNRLYTLCWVWSFDDAETLWGRAAERLENYRQALLEKQMSCEQRLELAKASLEFWKDFRREWRDEKAAFEENLASLHRVFRQASLDASFGMQMVMRNTTALKSLQAGLPSWLDPAGMMKTLVTSPVLVQTPKDVWEWPVYLQYFKDQPEERQRAAATDLISQIDDIPEKEEYYLDQIAQGTLLASEAFYRTHTINGAGNPVEVISTKNREMENFEALFGEVETYEELYEDYGYIDYVHYRFWMIREKRGWYGNDGDEHLYAPKLTTTSTVPLILNDLSGNSAGMKELREIYHMAARDLGMMMREARDGESSTLDYYKNQVEIAIQRNRSATCVPFLMDDYNTNVLEPLFRKVEKVLEGTLKYKEVLRLRNGRPSLMDAETGEDITLPVGRQYALDLAVEPADATIPDILYTCRNVNTYMEEVVSVDENGVITALATGVAYVTATALDSVDYDPISITYKVTVTAPEGFASVAEAAASLGEKTWGVLDPTLTVEGTTVSASGLLLYNSEENAPAGAVFCAVYDGDRYVGGTVTDAVLRGGEGVSFRADVKLDRAPQDPVMKVFLVGDVDMIPLEGFDPIVIGK